MRKAYWLIAVAVVLQSGTAVQSQESGGAFGVAMGQPVSSLKVVKKLQGNTYEVEVPKPNSEFEEYIVMAAPNTGVCKISALGKTHLNDRYGSDVRSAFDHLHAALVVRYGTAKDFDFLRAGSIWNDPQDFHMGVLKKERTLTSFWDRDNGSTLPVQLTSIMLDTRAVSSGPYVALSYEFANFGKCKSVADSSNDAGL